jgi:putative transposase
VLVRFAYLAVTNTFAALRLLPMSDREKDAEILALRHQLRILQRQSGDQRIRFEPADRALLAALLGTLPRKTLRQLQRALTPGVGHGFMQLATA